MRLVWLLTIGILCGCSAAGEPAAPIDDHHIRTLVGHVAEYHANPKTFETLFVDGAIPDKATRAKLRGMMTKLQRATGRRHRLVGDGRGGLRSARNRGAPGPRRVEARKDRGPVEGERFRFAGRICRKPVRG